MKNCNKQYAVEYIGDLPIDTLEKMPDFFLTERDIVDVESGNIVRTIERTPTAKIFPTITMDNVFGLEANNESIVVPENQVRAVRIMNEGSVITMQYADTTHAAIMLAVGQTADVVLCQNSGVVNLPKGHEYIINAQYYTGENGQPVTDPASGQKLFIPISATKLLINL